MPSLRFLQYLALSLYVLITGAALLFILTQTHVVRLVPYPIMFLSYGAMAPYQGYSTTNGTLLAEGQRETGEWEPISLSSYYPLRTGHTFMRMLLSRSMTKAETEDRKNERYARLAALLMQKEQEQGRMYTSIRLSWQEWPASPAGYSSLQREPFVETNLLARFP